MLNKCGSTAMFNQSCSEQIVFPTKGIYRLEISVEGLSPLSSDAVDTSRNGVARGGMPVG